MVKKRFYLVFIGLLLLIAILYSIYQIRYVSKISISYEQTNGPLYNPMMGFAPNADYEALVGENTLVFVEITFRELEPEEGVFAFDEIREKFMLERWKSEGKQVVFRFICDNPEEEEHMDIPDWLYEKTKDGDFYDSSYGKGYSPNYANETFIEYHEKAIKALGEEFGQDSFFCYIELGSIGHWGEWHVSYTEGIRRLPKEAICEEYVKPYVEAFPNAILLMRRPFRMVQTYNMGVFNDMTGEPVDTAEWLDWIEHGGTYDSPEEPHSLVASKNLWELRPVGGEFTSALTMKEMLETERGRTIGLLDQSHMTFIGPMMPTMEDDLASYEEDKNIVLQHLGYRYAVDTCKITLDKLFKKVKIEVTLANYGVAPMYVNWPVYLYRLNEDLQVIEKQQIPIDLTKLAGGEKKTLSLTIEDGSLKDAMIPIAIGIENPETEQPAISFDMTSKSLEKRYILWE